MEYSKKDIQNKLMEIGAAPNLTVMPAVIERLSENKILLDLLDVDLDGNILYKDNCITRKFKLNENGDAISYSGKTPIRQYCDIIEIDKFGMETKVGIGQLDGQIDDSQGYSERTDGNIYYQDSHIAMTIQDADESYSISDSGDWKIHDRNEDEKGNYRITNAYMGYIIANYPQTIEWFVEHKFLPESEKDINLAISRAIEETANAIMDSQLGEQRNQNIEELGFLGFGQVQLSPEEKARRVELITKEIEDLNILSTDYKEGNVNPGISYTEQESEENRIKYFKDKAKSLEEQAESREEKLKVLKEFALRCSKIPFVGKKLLVSLDETNLLLASGENEDRTIPNSELGDAYREYRTINGTIEKYKEVSNSIKDCVVNDCGRIPFIGKRIIKELDNIARNQRKEQDEREDDQER